MSYTLSSLLSQGKGLPYTLLAFQNNILPRKVSQNTQDFFSLYFFQSKQLSSENLQYLYIIKKKVCNFGKVENLFYYYLKIIYLGEAEGVGGGDSQADSLRSTEPDARLSLPTLRP